MDGAKNSRTGKEKREPRTQERDGRILTYSAAAARRPQDFLCFVRTTPPPPFRDTDLKAVTRSGHSKRRSALGHPRGQSMKDDTGWRRRSRRRRRLDGTFTIDAGELAAWGKLTRDPG